MFNSKNAIRYCKLGTTLVNVAKFPTLINLQKDKTESTGFYCKFCRDRVNFLQLEVLLLKFIMKKTAIYSGIYHLSAIPNSYHICLLLLCYYLPC